MKDAIRTGPRTGWRSGGEILDFTAEARGETQIDTAGSARDCFERDRAGFVVGTSDAARRACQSSVRDLRIANLHGERLLQNRARGNGRGSLLSAYYRARHQNE